MEGVSGGWTDAPSAGTIDRGSREGLEEAGSPPKWRMAGTVRKRADVDAGGHKKERFDRDRGLPRGECRWALCGVASLDAWELAPRVTVRTGTPAPREEGCSPHPPAASRPGSPFAGTRIATAYRGANKKKICNMWPMHWGLPHTQWVRRGWGGVAGPSHAKAWRHKHDSEIRPGSPPRVRTWPAWQRGSSGGGGW